MKKFLLILALLFGFFGKIFGALACALPPDILHEFRIDASENPVKIEYSLMTWDNLKPQVLTTLETNAHGKISENFEKILEENITKNTNFSFDGAPFSLKFLSGSVVENTENEPGNYLPNPILKATFSTDISIDWGKINTFSLDFNKKPLLDISPLIHPYIATTMQNPKNYEGYVMDTDGKIWDLYSENSRKIVIKSEYTEKTEINHFSLAFGLKNENFTNPNDTRTTAPRASTPDKINNSNAETLDLFQPGKTLKNFVDNSATIGLKIIGLVVALLAGMAHGLLPGHSKSLLVGYVSSSGKLQRKELFTIIAGVTSSHTMFIFLLALIIIALEK